MVVKPGPIDTPMIAHRINGGFTTTTTAYVAKRINGGIKSKKSTIYVPWFWRPVMSMLKLVPEKMFRKINI